MERAPIFWCLALCLGLLSWLLWDLNSMHINYDWHSYLLDPKTGHKTKPVELINLGRLINLTESYINATNSIERLYDLEYNTNLENPYSHEQTYSDRRQLELSGWPVANQSKCARELEWINSKLATHNEYQLLPGQLGLELTQLMDSFGKPETGLFAGTVTWMGSYKQCQRASLDGGGIRLRYCQANLRPIWWPTHERANPRTRIKMGLCIPETCDTLSFQQHKAPIEWLLKFELPEFYKKNLQFESMFCLPDERSPIRQLPTSGYVYLLVVGLWLTLVVSASIIYELLRWHQRAYSQEDNPTMPNNQHVCMINITSSKSTINNPLNGKQKDETSRRDPSEQSNLVLQQFRFQLLEMLSVHHSLKRFTSDLFEVHRSNHLKKTRVDLGCLDSVKLVMAITVILGHSGYLASVYTRSKGNRIDLNVNDNGHMALSLGRCVDSFFMFFGVLSSYTLLRKFSPEKLANPFTWLVVNLGILLRITPVFMLVYWYSRSISPYTGSGPWWDYGVYRYSMKGNCLHEPWWKSIPYFGCSGSPPVATCVLPAWFIVSYSQLSLIIPLITYLVYKLPGHLSRQLLVLFVVAISGLQLALKMYKQTSFKDEALTLYGGFLVNSLEKFESTGTMATLGRVGCVSIGCYAGYLLRMYELGHIKEWPRWLTSRLTLITTVALHFIVMFMPLIGRRLLQASKRTTTMHEFLGSYLSLMLIWPTLNATAVIICVTHYNRTGPVRFFSHSFWHSFNKLGLCIFLVHWEILFIGVTSYEQGPSMGFVTDIVKMWSFGVFFSILLAFAIHILIEAPLTAMLKLIAESFQSLVSSETNSRENGDNSNAVKAGDTHNHVRTA